MSGVPAAREDILALRSYKAGAQVDDTIRLNANEAPSATAGSTLNRYPHVRPATLQVRLAALFGVAPENLLVTRGSSEAIDALTRAWCPAYRSSIITTPPTFDMYRVYADIQGVRLIDVPLDSRTFALDADALVGACEADTRLVFLCSPNNPTGTLIAEADIEQIVAELDGRAIVVLDEAYIEFADRASMAGRARDHDNLVVLRTLSKAHALAGARCGAAIASEAVIDVLSKVLPPYSFPTPVIETVIEALSDNRLRDSSASVAAIVAERERVAERLDGLNCVRQRWPSHSNFILTRFDDLPAVIEFLFDKRILIRDFGGAAELKNCARITIGSPQENDALLDALETYGSAN